MRSVEYSFYHHSVQAFFSGILERMTRTMMVLTLFLLAGVCRLEAQGLQLTGTVRDENGKPLAGVTVRLITRTQGVKIGGTNSNGQFNFRDLGNGNYQLSFEKDGYVTVTRTVEVTFDKNGGDDDDHGEKVVMVRQ
jgi:hypothetical protein